MNWTSYALVAILYLFGARETLFLKLFKVEPIYLSSVVLGMLYHNDHFKRAMFSRLDKCSDLDFKSDPSTRVYKIARPMLAPTLTQTDRRAKNAPDFSVNWSILDPPNAMEMVNTSSGLRSNDKMPSRLSKTRLLDLFIETIRQLGMPQLYWFI